MALAPQAAPPQNQRQRPSRQRGVRVYYPLSAESSAPMGSRPRRLLVVQGSQVIEWPNLNGPHPVTHRNGEIRMDMESMRPIESNPAQSSWPVSRCINNTVPPTAYRAFSKSKKRRLNQKRKLISILRNSMKMRNLEERRDKLLAAVKKGKLELEYLSIQLYGMEAGEFPSTFGPMVRLKKQRLREKLDKLKELFEQFKKELAEIRKDKLNFKKGLSKSCTRKCKK